MLKRLIFDSEKQNRKLLHFIITIVYFVLHLIVVLNHEHWCDEAQAWILVKNLSIPKLFDILCIEGHPCLWFLVLMPFVKLGLPYEYMSFISLTIMSIVVFIYLEKSPFSLIVKLGTLLSSMFLYYNPVVCRTYSTVALVIVLTMTFRSKRETKPILYGVLVGLIFQTHVLAFGLGIGLTIELIAEYLQNKNNKSKLISIIIILCSVIVMLLELIPHSSYDPCVDTSFATVLGNINISNILYKLQYFAYTAWGWTNKPTYYIPYIVLIASIIFITINITINKSWKKNYLIYITAVCSIGVVFGVITIVYIAHTQMASILMMIIIAIVWMLYENNEQLNLRVSVLVLLTLNCMLTFAISQSVLRSDLKHDYSSSKKAAGIIETFEENSVVAFDNHTYDLSLYCYVSSNREDIIFYDALNSCEFLFHDMSKDRIRKDENILIDEVLNKYDNKNIYYTTCEYIKNDKLELIDLIDDENSRWHEIYYIYKIMR